MVAGILVPIAVDIASEFLSYSILCFSAWVSATGYRHIKSCMRMYYCMFLIVVASASCRDHGQTSREENQSTAG